MTKTKITIWTKPPASAGFLDTWAGYPVPGSLTTEHAQSSRGLPVAVSQDGAAYGAGEVEYLTLPDGEGAREDAESARAAGYVCHVVSDTCEVVA